MDFHAAMETFAEAWVAANTPTAVNLESHSHKPQSYHSEESHMSAVRTHGHTLHLVGPGGGLILDRSIPGIHRPSPSRSHSVETIMKDPEQNITTIGGSAKSLPIHCIVEQISGTPSFDSVTSAVCAPSAVELDSYAILPSSTLLSDLVHSALVKLGYNSADAIAAKGAIQIKNWKPLTFDAITNNAQATVEEILSELTNVATLRIRIASLKHVDWTTIWDDHAVRCATLGLLKELNQPTLAKLSPLCQSMISNIANGKYVNKLSMEKCKEFGEWYKQYKLQALDFPSISHKGTPKDTRLTFHPQHEVPLLKSWYAKCKHPSLEKLRFYCSELNKGHIRNARPPVTPARLKLWWKNEKQKERRQKKEEPACTSSQGQINPDSSSEMSVIEIRSDVQERCELDSSVHNIHRPIESSSMQILSTTYVDNQSWIH